MENKEAFERFTGNSAVLPFDVVNIKISVFGKSFVGKSALIHRFLYDKFITNREGITGDHYTIFRVVDSISCQMEIFDTVDQDDSQLTSDTLIYPNDAFVLVYSIDRFETFENVKAKYEIIKKAKDGNVFSAIIIGNKCDLQNEREVSQIEAQAYCAAINVPFLEVSALDKVNVNEAFLFVVNEYIIKKDEFLKANETKRYCCLAF